MLLFAYPACGEGYDMKTKLNIGCGNKPLKGYLNTDKVDFEGMDLKFDANILPYPFSDESFQEVRLWNVFEHLSQDTTLLLKEIHRILKKNGKLIINVPHYTCPSTYFSQHYKVFSSKSFLGYVKGSNYENRFEFAFKKIEMHIGFTRGVSSMYNVIIEKIANKNICNYYESTPLSLFPAKNITFTLIK